MTTIESTRAQGRSCQAVLLNRLAAQTGGLAVVAVVT
jgi:hypothetical protein